MKILITGSSGQLGKSLALTRPLEIGNAEVKVIKTTREEFNISDKLSCEENIMKYKPDWIINCGAYTAVDKAEREKNIANEINGNAPYLLAKTLKEIGSNLIHISTDFVFDGCNNKAYKKDHPVNPINAYGESKAIGEKLLLEDSDLENFFIIRTSWVLSNTGKNFLLTMLKLMSEREQINVVNDQIGCITSVANLSKICWELIKLQSKEVSIPNLLHFSDSGICTWFDVAQNIHELALKKELLTHKKKIIPVDSRFFNLPAKRPTFSLLNSQETYRIFNFTPTHWTKSIDILLDSLNCDLIKKLKGK